MASSSAAGILLFFTALLSLSISSYSRPMPCNTLLISYSFTSYSSDSNSDSTSSSSSLAFYRPSTFITVYRIISPLRASNLDRPSRPVQIERPQRHSHLASSLQDRARDILSVATGILFGVGCGALTGATLYFLFVVATNRHLIHYDDDVDDDEIDEYDEIPSPKKGGYVTIPVHETTADDLKVKEGFEKN